ncbi:MAG: potassium channel family protein, partial [Candidatus Margulisiibacteriota bacterium]
MKKIIVLLTILLLPVVVIAAPDLPAVRLVTPTTQGVSDLMLAVWKAAVSDQPQLGSATHVATVKTVAAGLSAVRDGRADVFIGPYTQDRSDPTLVFVPTHISREFGILLPSKNPSILARMWPFLRLFFGTTLAMYFLLMLMVAILIWFFEHREHPDQFPHNPLQGVGVGLWYALVTMTAVGYGDRVPQTLPGRIVASVWMLVTMVFLATVTVLVTAELASVKLSVA